MNPSLRAALLHPRFIIAVAAAIAAVAVVLTLATTNPAKSSSYVHPTQGPIAQEVDVPGLVQAAQTVDLSFQLSGRIAFVGAGVGAHVAQGTTLASIGSADLQASLEQARAALAMQQAKLDALKAGARPEDVAVAQTAVSGAQSSLNQAVQNLAAAAQSGYVSSDDAVHNRVDQFINNPRTLMPTLPFPLTDSQLQSSILADRVTMEALLGSWQGELAALPQAPVQTDAEGAAQTARANLQRIASFLDEVASGLTKVISTTSYPTATISGFETSVAVARGNITAAIGALNAAQTAETAAKAALASAQSALALKQAPATAQDVEAQTAAVASAQASIDAAEAQLGKTLIRAPFSGTVTRNDAHVGATAVPGAALISMDSDAQFQFQVYVSQADLSKVKVGDAAAITLDAYQNAAALPAHVVAIDPAATMQGSAAAYKVTLQFDVRGARVQAGLTGTAAITTASVGSALSVPTSAIITEGTSYFVIRKGSAGDEKVPVQIGVASAVGMTQVLSGLTTQDEVRTFGNQ